jgi:hypothetical protein
LGQSASRLNRHVAALRWEEAFFCSSKTFSARLFDA